MMKFTPKFTNYENRVRDSFARQKVMQTLGVSLDRIAPGHVTLSMPFNPELTQQHGFIHAGIITTSLDSAAGYAAFSLMPEDAAVLTVEFKTSLLAPAWGDHFVFRANVLKPGRTLSFVEAKAYAIENTQETLIATFTATMMAVTGRKDVMG